MLMKISGYLFFTKYYSKSFILTATLRDSSSISPLPIKTNQLKITSQSHRARKYMSWDLFPGLPNSQSHALSHLLMISHLLKLFTQNLSLTQI